MTNSEALEISEKYLKEMPEADDTANFELCTKRYEKKYLANFTCEIFSNDVKGMNERNGMNIGYEYLGTLRSSNLEGMAVFRTIWRGIYEKRDAVIEFGVYRKDGDWSVIQSAVH